MNENAKLFFIFIGWGVLFHGIIFQTMTSVIAGLGILFLCGLDVGK